MHVDLMDLYKNPQESGKGQNGATLSMWTQNSILPKATY